MGDFLVKHAGYILSGFIGLLGIIGYFIKRWMNIREEIEREIRKDIHEVKKSMGLIERNYLDRFKEITKNQNNMQSTIMGEFNQFRLDMTTQTALISQKLDEKHDPLREQIEKLLKKFEP